MTIRSTIVIEIQPEWVVKNLFCMANIYPYNFSFKQVFQCKRCYDIKFYKQNINDRNY